MNRIMMSVVLIGFPLFALGGLFWYLHVSHQHPMEIVNEQKIPMEVKDNSVQCPQCQMYIVGKKDTAQIIMPEGKTYFFDDIGCAILWSKERKFDLETTVFWVYTKDSLRWINANDAFYSIIDETPMNYGFSAYEKEEGGMISFPEMRLRMLRGENMSDPKVRKKLLGK